MTSDIANIIVATHEHTPIYVRDLAEVKIGAELRQGAVTANGEGEAVAGIVHDAQRRERARRGERGKRKIARLFRKRCPTALSLCRFTTAPISSRKRSIPSRKRSRKERSSCSSCSLFCSPMCAARSSYAGPAAGRALRLHHDEMVRPERQSDVVRRACHRHRHDGRWRGRDGGKHSSTSDRETATRRKKHARPTRSRSCSMRRRKSAGRSSSAYSLSSSCFCRCSRSKDSKAKCSARSPSRFRLRCSAR